MPVLIFGLERLPTLHGGFYHLVCVVALVVLAFALVTLVLSIVLASSPNLCWHHCPHCAGIAAPVVLALLHLLRWCSRCLRHGLPCCLWLSTCQLKLNKGKDACKLTAQCKHNEDKEACMMRVLMPLQQGQQCQYDKGSGEL